MIILNVKYCSFFSFAILLIFELKKNTFTGHLPLKLNDFKRRYRSLTATYVTFSPDGKDLLANLGGEQIYLFNVISRRKQMVFDMSERALNFAFDVRESCDDLKMDCCGE